MPTINGGCSMLNAGGPFVNLHTRSWFSFLRGGSSPIDLAARASELGMDALAITDVNGVYGVVRFQQACREHGIRPIFGTELQYGDDRMVLLARTREGYANICRIITTLNLAPGLASQQESADAIPPASADFLSVLDRHSNDLICLAGCAGSRIERSLASRDDAGARDRLRSLRDIYGDRLYFELANHAIEGSNRRLARSLRLAKSEGVPTVATNDVLYARPEDYARFDLVTCIRLIDTVFNSHPERPRNAEACLKSREMLFPMLIPDEGAFARSLEIAQECNVNLLPEEILLPPADLPPGSDPATVLRALCEIGFIERVPKEREAKARIQLEKELAIINRLELAEFFLVVHEVVCKAKEMRIRYAGRGSAASSIVAFLLHITHVDPIEHNLLFERFLHGGRKGTPDIDVDFDSERRPEMIAWMEHRFGVEQTAMTASVIMYGLRMAVRDVGKTFGWDLETINGLTKRIRSGEPRNIRAYEPVIRDYLGDSLLVTRFLEAVESLQDCPRHLGQHSGGMVLSRHELPHYTPVQISANGVKVIQFDKDDIEQLGLLKFDVLGLRMLASVSEAWEMIKRHEGLELEFETLPLDDVQVFNMIRSTRTLGLFQIESQGQMHLLAQTQPEHFYDLVAQIALFRPGPLQADMVRPYTLRRRGVEPVTYLHENLVPPLKRTYGILLFQDQILEVAHHFAGMTLSDADDFRKFISKDRNKHKMEGLRPGFVAGAMRKGASEEIANEVFNQVAKFVGFGFCRSHAAAFAQTVYISAWLKTYHPAAYFASFMQHHPGMYSQMTIEEEARRFGVETLLPDIRYSMLRYDLEPTADGRLAIRKPLTAVKGLSTEDANAILDERGKSDFRSMEDFYRRVPLHRDTLESLATSGALDALAGNSRKALWEIGVLANRIGPAGNTGLPTLLAIPAIEEADDVPDLPILEIAERLSWDYQAQSSARIHPMVLARRALNELEVRTIETCYRLKGIGARRKPYVLKIAGIVVLRQMPPTANGYQFLMLEDETGYIQVIVPPPMLKEFGDLTKQSALMVEGKVQIYGNWRGMIMQQARQLSKMIGGFEGTPSASGGKDRLKVEEERTVRAQS